MQTASTLRAEAIEWLRREWPAAVIIPELSVGSWGSARLDIAAVLPDELIGVEIKGDGDSIARLSLQGMIYSAVCSRMFLYTSTKLRPACVKALPPGWCMARNTDGLWWEVAKEEGSFNYGHHCDRRPLPTSPIRLVDTLWASELKMLIDIHGVFIPQKKGREARVKAVADEVPLKLLRPTVYWLLHRRQWEDARFGAKLIYRPADAAA